MPSEKLNQPRILFSYWDGGRCHLNRTIAIATEAVESGIECGFVTSEKFAADIGRIAATNNVFVIPNRPPATPKPPYDFPLYSHAYGHGQRLRGLGFTNEEWIARTTAQEINAIERFRPDVIVNDYRDTIRTAAEVKGVPIIGVTHTTGNVDGQRFGWWQPPPPGIRIPHSMDSFNAVRASYNLFSFDDERYMFTGDVSFLPSSPAIDPLIRKTHPSYYIGKVARPRPDDGSFRPMDARLANKRVFSYVGEASRPQYGYQQLLADAIESMPSTGFYIDGDVQDYSRASILGRLTNGSVVINRTMPGPRVIEDSDAVLCHGGHGTVMQALTQGVPIIGVGPYQTDCSSIMQNVTGHGAGLLINHSAGPLEQVAAPDLGDGISIFGYWHSEITGDQIRHALETVFNDPLYAENARKLGREILALGGAQRAVEICREVIRETS